MRVAQQQAGHDRRNGQKIGVRAQILFQPLKRAARHRRGQPQARQRFQRGELRKRAAQNGRGEQRVAQHQRTGIYRQTLHQPRRGHRRLGRFLGIGGVTRTQRRHGIPRQHHVRLLGQRRRIQQALVVFQKDAADARRDARTPYATDVRQRAGDLCRLVRQQAQPVRRQAQPPRQAVNDASLHQILLCFAFNHDSTLLFAAAAAISAARAPGVPAPLRPKPASCARWRSVYPYRPRRPPSAISGAHW